MNIALLQKACRSQTLTTRDTDKKRSSHQLRYNSYEICRVCSAFCSAACSSHWCGALPDKNYVRPADVLCSTDSIGVLLLTSFCQVSAPERRLGDTHPRRRTFLASPGERPESHLTGEL